MSELLRHIAVGKPEMLDRAWFERFPERQTRIRLPMFGEAEAEFRSLGPHQEHRRRILVWKTPADCPMPGQLVPIPFLLFSDETLENEDAVLLPVINEIMGQAADEYGVEKRVPRRM